MLRSYRRERRFKFTFYIGANNDQLKSEATCGLLYVVQLRVNGPLVGIHQDSDNVYELCRVSRYAAVAHVTSNPSAM